MSFIVQSGENVSRALFLILTVFLIGISSVPCHKPLGVRKTASNSSPSSEIEADVNVGDGVLFLDDSNLEESYVKVTASNMVLLTGIRFQGDDRGEGRVVEWTLALSDDCQQYTEQNYSLPIEYHDLASNESISVSLHSYAFAKCMFLAPNRLVGTNVTLRFELLGCEVKSDDNVCGTEFLLTSSKNEETVTNDENPIFAQTQKAPYSIIEDALAAENMTFDEFNYLMNMTGQEIEDFYPDVNQDLSQNNNYDIPAPNHFGDFSSTLQSDIIVNEEFSVDIDENTVYRILDYFMSSGDENQSELMRLSQEGCGVKPLMGKHVRRKRVVGGHVNSPGEWPWLVSLHYLPQTRFSNTSGYDHLCGATLISSQWLVGAAHCFENSVYQGLENLSDWRVYLGMHDQAMDGDDDTVQTRNISFILRHSNYAKFGQSFHGDIALIKLDRPVEYTNTVRPLCVDETEIFRKNSVCYATGWGQTSLYEPGTRFPHTAALFVLTTDECKRSYAGLPDDHEFKSLVRAEEDIICAYGLGGQDTCQGDSGGGLMCTSDNKWYLAGSTVGGYLCGNKHFPGFYTRISHYHEWIKTNMEIMSLII